MCVISLYFHNYLARFRQNISFWRLDDKTFKCPALYLPVTDLWSAYAMIGPFICDLVTALFQGNYFWFSFQFEWWKSVTWLRKKAWFLWYSYRRRQLFQRAHAHCSQRRPAQSNGRGQYWKEIAINAWFNAEITDEDFRPWRWNSCVEEEQQAVCFIAQLSQ